MLVFMAGHATTGLLTSQARSTHVWIPSLISHMACMNAVLFTSKLSHNPFANFPSVLASKGAMTMMSAQFRSYHAHEHQTLGSMKSNLPRYARWDQISFSTPKSNNRSALSLHTLVSSKYTATYIPFVLLSVHWAMHLHVFYEKMGCLCHYNLDMDICMFLKKFHQ